MATIAVTDSTFDQDVIQSKVPVLVDFWAEWCGPCKQIGPSLEELSESFAGAVTIAKVNIDDNPETPGKFGVRGIPALLIFEKGELKATKVGASAKSAIAAWITSETGATPAKTAID